MDRRPADSQVADQPGYHGHVFDPHVHSFMDWARLPYTYNAKSVFAQNWCFENYVEDVIPSALPPSEFMYMSLVGVPRTHYILQSQMAQEEADRIARQGASPAMVGIISDGDPGEGLAFGGFLDELLVAAPLVRGIRVRHEAKGSFPASWTAGLRELGNRGLTFELLLARDEQLECVFDMASLVPDVAVVIDHMGMLNPRPNDEPPPSFEVWAAEMGRFAKLPKVYVKLSGGAAPGDATATLRPYVAHLVRTFGYEKLIFSSNWFVVNFQQGFGGYRAWADAVMLWLSELEATKSDMDWLFHRAAKQAYGFGLTTDVQQRSQL